MDFWTLIDERRSIRKFTSQDVSADDEDRLLKAANSAPSAGDLQGYGIFSIREPKTKDRLAAAAWGQNFVASAPLVLVFYADTRRSATRYAERGIKLYSIQDATIAATFVHLAATSLGIGSVWTGAFKTDEVREILALPPVKIPVVILPVGHPLEKPRKTPRRELEDLVTKIP
ncbi:MAG: nitroreductase family protein [Candidatus Odinarchaeota archaeon]